MERNKPSHRIYSLPRTADRTNLTNAFKELRKQGFEAHQNWQCCQSCGCAALSGKTSKYVFYHRQDATTLKSRGECYFAWGDDAADGKTIVEVLNRHGLKTMWDGTTNERIHVFLTERSLEKYLERTKAA